MLNAKIYLTLFVTVLVLIGGSLMVTNQYFGAMQEEDMVRDLAVARETVLRSKALDLHGQMAIADKVGVWPKFQEKLLKEYPEGIEGLDERHQLVWEELNVWNAKLKAASTQQSQQSKEETALLEDRRALVPDEMYVVDATGSVVARFTDYAWWGNNIAKDLPVVLSVAGSRRPVRDIWNSPGAGMMEVTVAPIFGVRGNKETGLKQEAFLGSVVLAYKMSDLEAERLKSLTGTDISFFYGAQVTAGTLGVDLLKALQSEIVAKTQVRLNGRLNAQKVQELNHQEYRMTAGLFTGYTSNATAGFILLLDRKVRLQSISKLNTYIPLAGAGFLLLMLAVASLIIRGFVKPFEEIDQGIHEFINGNTEYTFPTSDRESLSGNMAHSLNMMACILQGKPIPDDEDGLEGDRTTSESWKDPLFIDGVSHVRKAPQLVALPGGLTPPKKAEARLAEPEEEEKARADADVLEPISPDAAQDVESTDKMEPGLQTQELAIEPEEIYFRRLFEEYLAARHETGEGVKGITFEKFRARLKRSEAQIKEELDCSLVRFRVQTKDGKATLKPIPME